MGNPVIWDRPQDPAARRGRQSRGHSHLGPVLIAIGLVYLLGSVVDIGTLWGLQRQPGPNWEFVALGRTLDALPRFGLAFALIMTGLWAGRIGAGTYRLCGVGLLVLGLGSGGLAALLATDYFAIVSAGVPEPAAVMARSTAIKGIAIGGLGLVLFGGAGVLSLRSPER